MNLPPYRPGCARQGLRLAYGERAPAEDAVVRWSPSPDVSFSPLADLHGTLTPNALFYEVTTEVSRPSTRLNIG